MRRRPTEALRFFLSSSVVLALVVLLLGTTLECILRRRWTGCSLVVVSLLLVSMRSKVELIMLPSLSFLTTRRMTFLTIFFLVGEGGASPAELATAAVGAMVNPKSNTGIYKRWSGVCVCVLAVPLGLRFLLLLGTTVLVWCKRAIRHFSFAIRQTSTNACIPKANKVDKDNNNKRQSWGMGETRKPLKGLFGWAFCVFSQYIYSYIPKVTHSTCCTARVMAGVPRSNANCPRLTEWPNQKRPSEI